MPYRVGGDRRNQCGRVPVVSDPLNELAGVVCQNRALTEVHEDLRNEYDHLLDSILDVVELLSPAFPELVLPGRLFTKNLSKLDLWEGLSTSMKSIRAALMDSAASSFQ